MNRAELRQFSKVEVQGPSVGVHDIVNPNKNRTLLLLGRNSLRLHVWLADGLLHRVIMSSDGTTIEHRSGRTLPVSLLHMDLPAYSESTEYAFAHLLAARGVKLYFQDIDEERGDRRLADHHPYQCPVAPERNDLP